MNREVEVEGPNNTKIVGRVTDVTGSGKVTEIETADGNKYESCPISGKFYKK